MTADVLLLEEAATADTNMANMAHAVVLMHAQMCTLLQNAVQVRGFIKRSPVLPKNID